MKYEEYTAFVKKHSGRCAICKRPERAKNRSGKIKKLSIDHCHKTKKLRGVLCSGCNIAIGLFKEDIKSLKNAIKYLTK